MYIYIYIYVAFKLVNISSNDNKTNHEMCGNSYIYRK